MSDTQNNPKPLIKVEAVNIYATLNLSDNLSVYRGASLTLREVMFVLLDEFNQADTKLTALSLGASVGLYSCDNPQKAKKDITEFLSTHYLGYTFVISTHENDSCFKQAKEALIQQGRMAQLKQTGISFSNLTNTKANTKGNNLGVCQLSGLLVANSSHHIKGEAIGINDVLRQRFDFGKVSRQAFYQRELAQGIKLTANKTLPDKALQTEALKAMASFVQDLNFTHSIEDIAKNSHSRPLENKVAYIYMDGNKFSKIQQAVVNNADDQYQFDVRMQVYRAEFLYKLLEWAKHDKRFKTDEGTIRLETLLWGGDECLFVMPATVGFEFVYQFFDWSKEWTYQGHQLTHSVGLVFCQQSTPVGKMRDLAQSLADDCKEKIIRYDNNHSIKQQANNNTQIIGAKNAFDFMILESIDYPTSSLNAHYDICYADLAEIKKQHINLLCQTTIADALTALKNLSPSLQSIGKSQIYQLASAAFAPQNIKPAEQSNQQPLATQEARLKAVCELSTDALNDFVGAASTVLLGKKLSLDTADDLKHRALLWVYLTQAWAYLMVGDKQ
jgi:hypothetical protein